MRLAILTDIHANRQALQAVLGDISHRKIDQVAVLGDIVGYGPDPQWCTERVAEMVMQGAICVMGNHDEVAAAKADASFRELARKAIEWTAEQLSARHKAFLAGLPKTANLDDILFVHASANDPSDWIYVTSESRAMPGFHSSKARLILCGHVHVPALYSCDLSGRVTRQRLMIGHPVPLVRSRRWLGVVGSVGQPRDGVAQAGYATLDTANNELTFRRVPYDTAGTAAAIRSAGLPEALAVRLMRGE